MGRASPLIGEPALSRSSSRRVALVLVGAAAAAAALMSSTRRFAPRGSSALFGLTATSKETADAVLSFTVSNEYSSSAHPLPGVGYLHLDPLYVAEPGRQTTLSAVAQQPHAVTSCSWRIELEAGELGSDAYDGETSEGRLVEAAGATLQLAFPRPGTFSVELACETEAGARLSLAQSQKIACSYVRRELRELSATDRDAFLETFLVLASTTTGAGRQLYGAHFKALSEFEAMHLVAAGGLRTDHVHDGLGLASQHISLSAEFEISMQSVCNWMALPYWDYTIDAYDVKYKWKGKTQSIFTESELFTDDWFGPTAGERNTVVTGRFAYLEVPVNGSAEMHSPFGYLRAPWNVNPSPFVTRYHELCGMDLSSVGGGSNAAGGSNGIIDYTWPTCAAHHKQTFSHEYDTFYKWAWNVGYVPHGPVHAWIGGVGGACKEAFDGLTALIGSVGVRGLKAGSFGLLKDAYRSKIVTMPTYCANDAEETCRWQCADFSALGPDSATTSLAIMFLKTYGVDMSNLSWTNQLSVVETVFCDTTYWPGDHLEAASPIEASFWPIHPTIERLLQYKMLALPFKSMVWVDETAGPGKSDYCTESMTSCDGHHPWDMTFWQTTYLNGSSYVKSYLSNEEVIRKVQPTANYSLPYIYNHFEWAHCDDQSYPFRTLG